MDQPKLVRLLRLMKLLTTNTSMTIDEIADKLALSSRSIYRYVDTFREAGFVVKKVNNCIRFDTSSPYFKDISELIHFTDEEACILKSAIESIDENNILKQNLKKKLYTVYDYKILADTIVNGKNGRNVQKIVEAIENKKQLVFKNYSSAHGNNIRDRRVEAYAFTTNYVQIWCFCLEENKNKLFKVSRIDDVEILQDSWKCESEHRLGSIDVFRISSEKSIPVKLRLSLRAVSLLLEEYPLSEKYISKLSDQYWLFETKVCSIEGVGRFVMGLLDDIEIIESQELRRYILFFLNKYKAKNILS
ncbi:MAG: helix-turn-helix transcriptional regulator [Bacteroidales bacterium]